MRVPGQLPSVQDVRETRAAWVVDGKLAIAGVIGAFAMLTIGPSVVSNGPWASIAGALCAALLVPALFRCSSCGRRRPLFWASGKRCPYCTAPSATRPEPIEPR
jgi:hypothetical protein